MTVRGEDALAVLLLAMATGAISFTVTRSSMPVLAKVREWLMSHMGEWSELLHCPYCASHYVGLAFMLAYRPRILMSEFIWLDYFVTWFALVGFAMAPIFALLFISRQD